MRILNVESSADSMSIELALRAEGFNVYTTDLGEEAVDLVKIYNYDLIVLDPRLPDLDGLDVLRMIRAAKVPTPVIIVSGIGSIEAKIRLFESGADDYLVKPYHRSELIARIHAVIRRTNGHAQSIMQVGPIALDLASRTLKANGRRIHLTGREYQMFEIMVLRRGTTLTKQFFLDHLYGGMDEPEIKIVDVYVCKMRKKLADAGVKPSLIQTVWGRGYKIDATDVQDLAA